jgi:uncharacterized protein (TIGR02757 family)
MRTLSLKKILDRQVALYNRPSFIPNDPVSIPHGFTQPADIEIAGLFAAIFAWGNRTTIINKSKELMALMNHQPHHFILHYSNAELKKLLHFKHRTFNADDLLYFVQWLHHHYSKHNTLETAFTKGLKKTDHTIENGLNSFRDYFFVMEHLPRTRKHISAPLQNSSCKRLNMFLRWMVRRDDKGVDFGLWKTIQPRQLICPLDVHVARVARQLGLLHRKQNDWAAALELTENLRVFDPNDPVKYDFALFGQGVLEKQIFTNAAKNKTGY